MSDTNSLSNESESSPSLNINEISSDHRGEYEQMAHQIQQQLFIDSNDNYQQRMFLSYRCALVGNEFVRYLYDFIYDLDVPGDLHQNVDKSNTDINRTCDDIENILLDQIEFEHDIAVFNSVHENQAGN